MSYITNLANEIGIIPWLLVLILIWTLIWKLIGMWRSAKNNHLIWFIVIAFFNTIGILPILYIYIFSELKQKDFKKNNIKSKKKKYLKKRKKSSKKKNNY